jgi:tetratricopeptide (TPR) repeat protein
MDETAATVTTFGGLSRLLRELRRRQARHQGDAPVTYRELAAATGWSHGIVGDYLSGKVLPPTDRFDVLIRLLGATPAEQGRLATARDRVEESRRPATPEPWRPAGAGTLAALDRWLDRPGHGVVAISGTSGVGKTTLAIHWAHRLIDRFPDGQLHLNLRGFDPGVAPVPAAEALRTFIGALGVEPARITAGLDAQSALYRSLLAGRRVLVALDNAATAEQVRPLLPGGPGSLVLVTSRAQLTGLVAAEGAHPVAIDLLPAGDARALLAARIGADRIAAEPRAANRIIMACTRLPLALAVVGARLAVQPALSLAALADQLDRDRLTTLDTGDPAVDVRAVLSWSYLRLPPDVARLFRLLALHPGPEISLAALASLAGEPAERLGDEAWQLYAHRSAAGAMIRLRRFDVARDMLGRSAALAARVGDLVARAQAENTLAWLLELEGDPAAAIPYAEQAAALFAAAGERQFAARSISSTGWYAALTGDFTRALAVRTQALTGPRELDDRSGLAGTLDSLGYICDNLGQPAAASAGTGRR